MDRLPNEFGIQQAAAAASLCLMAIPGCFELLRPQQEEHPMQDIPDKPAFILSDAEYHAVLEHYGHKCVLLGSTCMQPCDRRLSFDHKQSQKEGGDDSFANLRPYCQNENSRRGAGFDPKWEEPNFWDGPTSPSKLRFVQGVPFWDELENLGRASLPIPIQHLRRALLPAITLLPGVTGMGKMLTALSVLCRFNQLIGLHYPRVKNALLLTTDTTLRDTALQEIERDGIRVGFFSANPPSVAVATSYNQLRLGPQGHAITVATVQTLWDVKTPTGMQRRSDDEKRLAMWEFDTIIFDECDWANDQLKKLADIATHALKFALTASPVGTSGTFAKRFALISKSSVGGYDVANGYDHCLKHLSDRPITAAPHDQFEEQVKGECFTKDGVMGANHVLFRSAILEQVRDIDRMETDMRRERPDDYYSPHIMVRMDDIKSIKAMHEDLQGCLARMRAEGKLANEGWEVTAVFQGCENWRKLPRNERDLSAMNGDRFLHPFMAAKNNDGRCTKQSKRILLMCAIGVRGINNWTINTTINCSTLWGIVDLLQWDLGRPLRWPKDRADWVDQKSLRRFCEVRNVIPRRPDAEQYCGAWKGARDFLLGMGEMVPAMGFSTWADLVNGVEPNIEQISIPPTTRALEPSEKIKIQTIVAGLVDGSSDVEPSTVIDWVNSTFPSEPENVRVRMGNYGTELLTNKKFRQEEMTSEPTLKANREAGLAVMAKLVPQDSFHPDALLEWAKSDDKFNARISELTDILSDPSHSAHHWAREAVGERLRQRQAENYRPLDRRYRLYNSRKPEDDDLLGVMTDVENELSQNLYKAGVTLGSRGLVPAMVRASAKELYAVDSAEEGGALDNPAYHLAILLQHRRALQKMAFGKLVQGGHLGEPMQRFGSVT